MRSSARPEGPHFACGFGRFFKLCEARGQAQDPCRTAFRIAFEAIDVLHIEVPALRVSPWRFSNARSAFLTFCTAWRARVESRSHENVTESVSDRLAAIACGSCKPKGENHMVVDFWPYLLAARRKRSVTRTKPSPRNRRRAADEREHIVEATIVFDELPGASALLPSVFTL